MTPAATTIRVGEARWFTPHLPVHVLDEPPGSEYDHSERPPANARNMMPRPGRLLC